jgi:protein SCO1/2
MFGRRAGFAGLEGLVERVRLFCTYYDPSSERYKFDYSIFISMAVGLLSMLGFATILVNAWRRSRRDRRRA